MFFGELEMELWRDAMHTLERRREPALTHRELERFLRNEFPRVLKPGSALSIEEFWHGGAQVPQAYREDSFPPGTPISGPPILALPASPLSLPLPPHPS